MSAANLYSGQCWGPLSFRDEDSTPTRQAGAESPIEALYDVTTTEAAATKLEAMGPAAIPMLLRALGDPRTKTARYRGRLRHLPQAPLEQMCDLLRPHAPLDDASVVAPFLEHEDPGFSEGLFDARRVQSDSAIRLLILLDEKVARAQLLNPEHFDPKRGGLGLFLAAFNEREIEIPRERLGPLLAHSDPYVYAQAIMALAITGDAPAKKTLQAALKSRQSSKRLAAARGLARMRGVVDPNLTLYDRIERTGFDELSDVFEPIPTDVLSCGSASFGGDKRL